VNWALWANLLLRLQTLGLANRFPPLSDRMLDYLLVPEEMLDFSSVLILVDKAE
jgi:hypothetical protein